MGGIFMKTLKLTLIQWSLLALAVLVGALVIALKLQGSKLHLLKLQLMKKELDIAIEKDDNNIAEKKKAYKKAKKELKK